MEISQVNLAAGSALANNATMPPVSPPPSPAAAPDAAQKATEKAEQGTPSIDQVRSAVAEVQKAYQPLAQDLEFSIDKETGKMVVKLLDSKTNTVLRQIPSEEILAIARSLDRMQGLLVNQTE